MSRALTVSLALLGLGVVAYGLYLVVVGPVGTVVPAVPLGESPRPGVSRTFPTLSGLIPLLGGVLLLAGLALRQLALAWAGAVVIGIFAALFVLGVGGVLLPIAVILWCLLGVRTWLDVVRGPRATS
jgi:hypothetical protein